MYILQELVETVNLLREIISLEGREERTKQPLLDLYSL